MSDQVHARGLTSAQAARRLHELGAPEPQSSRSVASIVAGNVFTLFNAILARREPKAATPQDATFRWMGSVSRSTAIRRQMSLRASMLRSNVNGAVLGRAS
jgi:hypothetical protein